MFAIYSSQKTLAIDESVFMVRKAYALPTVWGKILTESSGAKMKIQVYLGAADDMGGKGHAANIVLHLASSYLGQEYRLYMYNYYNSVHWNFTKWMERES